MSCARVGVPPAFLSILLLVSTTTSGRAGDSPPLLWSVSDDTLAVPFGIICDVAVDSNHIVYLLDSQNLTVRRISTSGVEMPPLGRQGEGPGEFMHPIRVVARPEGGCVVLQDFHDPPVCLTADGRVCASPDVDAVRDRYYLASFFDSRMDMRGRLLVALLATSVPSGTIQSTTDMQSTWSIIRFDCEGLSYVTLFADNSDLADEHTVDFARYGISFTANAWDVDPLGQLLYADPEGGNRVVIGHPADGEVVAIDLPEYPDDPDRLKKFARSVGSSLDEVPRVAAVHSLTRTLLLARPTACLPGAGKAATLEFELLDYSGRSHGRRVLDCDYDSSADGMYITRGILVVVKGGKSIAEATLRQQASMIGLHLESKPDEDGSQSREAESITISAYDLAAYYTAR